MTHEEIREIRVNWYDFKGNFICAGTPTEIAEKEESGEIESGWGVYPGEEATDKD